MFVGNEDLSTQPEKELGMSVESANNACSELADSIKRKLESLLDLLVDSSKGASIEMLERYYSALQGCIHKWRHTCDKTELVKVCGVRDNIY